MNGSITTAYDRVFKNIDRRLRIVENRETPSSGGGGGTTVVHAHINDTSGGVIDYLRTQWGTDHTNPALDPHTQYLNQARGDARYSLIAHNHNAAYAALGTMITAGSGLTGGGDLSANRTLNVGAGTGITVAADTVAVDQTFLDSRYALVAHNHDATYSPLNHNHDPVYVNVAGDTMTGALTNQAWIITPSVYFDGPAGTARGAIFTTSTARRWTVETDTSAETGSNAGSNLRIVRYADAGTAIEDVLTINRATGATVLDGNFSMPYGHVLSSAILQINLAGGGTVPFKIDQALGYFGIAREGIDYDLEIRTTGELYSRHKAVNVSPDAGNIITWRNNGFFAAAGAIQISADPDNILEVKPDGLFVRKGLLFGK
jgi:hypothetical protein